jgi:hypothetical protein
MTDHDNDETLWEASKKAFTMIGSLAALAWNTYWTLTNDTGKYRQLTLDVTKEAAANAMALTTLENKADFHKKVTYAGLVIAPGKGWRLVVRDLRDCVSDPAPPGFSGEAQDSVTAYLPRVDQPRYCPAGRAAFLRDVDDRKLPNERSRWTLEQAA